MGGELRRQGVDPTAELLAERMGLGVEELTTTAQRLDSSDVSLDAPTECGGAFGDAFAAEVETPEAQAARAEVAQLTRRLMSRFEQGLHSVSGVVVEAYAYRDGS